MFSSIYLYLVSLFCATGGAECETNSSIKNEFNLFYFAKNISTSFSVPTALKLTNPPYQIVSITPPLQGYNSSGIDLKSLVSRKIFPVVEKPSAPVSAICSALLHPKKMTILCTDVEAPIKKIHYQIGESFKKGAVLVEMENKIIRGEYEKSRVFLNKAREKYRATKSLYDDNFASNFELEEAKANLADAQQRYLLAQHRLDSTVIRAPYSGRVASVFTEEFEFPSNTKQLMKIIDDASLIAKMKVKDTLLREIRHGDSITLKIDSIGKKIVAKVTHVGPMVEPSDATIALEAEIDNKVGNLKAGMAATVTLPSISNKKGTK